MADLTCSGCGHPVHRPNSCGWALTDAGRGKPPCYCDVQPKPDLVNHPPHYTAHPSGVECIDVVEHMTFNIGNAVKYLWRAGLKGDVLEDLRKAKWYVEREIAKLQRG